MSDSRVVFDMTTRFMSDFEDELDAHSYPVTTEELVSAHGELTLKLSGGTETFGETIRRLGEQTFADPEEVRLATYSVLSADAVGRVGYSDRDAPGIGEVGYDQVSF
jgi:hypothetical protein